MRPASLEADSGMLCSRGLSKDCSQEEPVIKGRRQTRVMKKIRKDEMTAPELNLSLILWRALECERHLGIVAPEGKC